ncbi:MAG TPA: hypothetical protein VF432_03955, partial [Thermoanaerobaculia bacterium]
SWQFTPLPNGKVEFIFTEDDDPGIPYWVYNRFFLRNKVGVPNTAQRVFNMAQYQNKQFAFLRQQ